MVDAAMPKDGRSDFDFAMDSTSMITESTDNDPEQAAKEVLPRLFRDLS